MYSLQHTASTQFLPAGEARKKFISSRGSGVTDTKKTTRNNEIIVQDMHMHMHMQFI